MTDSTRQLVRWRADPSKIRVSLRHVPAGWRASIAFRRDDGNIILGEGVDIEAVVAVWMAIVDATAYRYVKHLDLDCDGAYEHPWKSLDGTQIKGRWGE